MRKTVIISLAFAIVIAFIFSLIISKRLSTPAKVVSESINEIAQGNLSVRIPTKGVKEISLIAHSANELAAKLEQEESLRHQWASDIAHDLKTPVAALRSQLEGMADGVLDITKERIYRNLRELSRIETLVNDLGELTRLESPEMHIKVKKIDTETFLKDLKNRFSRQFEEKKITVEWNNRIETFKGDENLIQRAVSNIVSNAIRHTHENGKITVTVRSNRQRQLITVFNTGEGISKDEIKKVFDRLYRGEYARKAPGSGLGLTIAQKIAELHGGKVTISSKEGYGTTVEMVLSIQ